MSPLIILAVLAGVPLVLTTLLRVKPLYVFVSIITGYFWAEFLGESAELVLRSLVHVSHPEVVIRLILLLLPLTLTLMLLAKTLSKAALPFQFSLLVFNSLLLLTFMLPLLTPGTQGTIYQTQTGSTLRQAHDVIIAGTAALHLLVMYLTRTKVHGKHGKKHHR